MTHRFAFANVAVMTGQAVAGIGTRMIERRTCKAGGVMTNSAILVVWTCRYMIRQFTDTDYIVVACITATGDARMIIRASAESARGMAVATILIVDRTRIVRIGWHVRIERCGKWFA